MEGKWKNVSNRFDGQVFMQLLFHEALDVFKGACRGCGATATGPLVMNLDNGSLQALEFNSAAVAG